ncbi:MAG: hypothetical protein RLZZ502_994 [Pseudomonadota bacterium]|jgi:LysR family hydrogen peroxide-inducible transcriptional activator
MSYKPQDLVSLRHLSYLAAVADTLNFTRAAERCFVTQSTLSGGIAELERTLATTLIERDRKSVRMTDIGLDVLERARHLLAASSELKQFVKHRRNPMQGVFVLGAIPTIAPYLLPRLLQNMHRQFPECELHLREMQTEPLLTAIEQGDVDAGLVALPMRETKLQCLTLFEDELYAVCAPQRPLPQKLAHIKAQDLILLGEGHCLRDHALQACKVIKAPKLEASSLTTLLAMVAVDMGVTLLPKMAIEAGALKGFKLRSALLGNARRTVALVTHHSSSRRAVVESLCAQLRNPK